MFRGFLRKDIFIYGLLLAVACLSALFPVLLAGYIHVDDPQHFINNPLVLAPSPNPFQAFFFTPNNVNRTYVPLTTWSFYVESLFFQANPFVSHLINLVLHYMVVLLVMFLGRRLGLSLKAAFVGALIFAVHPMHVESVAWVTERKDVLYSFFYLAALVFYIDYLDKKEGRKYIVALVAAALSVLAKPMALSLPFILLLVDIFRGRKFSWGMALDKVPFFLVVEPIAFITYSMNVRGAAAFDFFSPFIAIWCLVFYIQKFFIPIDVSFFLYKAPWPVWDYQAEYIQALVMFCGIILALFLLRRCRWSWFAFLYYALSTFFLWRIDGNDAHFVADRFMYLPSIGFCFLIGHLLDMLPEKELLKRRLLFGGFLCLVLVFMVVSFMKARVWHSTFSMYMEVHRRGSNNFELARGLAMCLRSDWCVSSSCTDIRKAYFSDQKKFGFQKVCGRKIRLAAQMLSMKELKRLLAVYPANVMALVDIGGLYWEWGGYDKAILYFKRSAAILPDQAGGYYMLGLCYEGKNDLKQAMVFLDKAMRLDPSMPETYVARSRVAASVGDKKKAVADVLKLIELKPNDKFSYDHAVDVLEKIKATAFVTAVRAMKEKIFSLAVMRQNFVP